jgi:hypothetical protein
MSRREQFSVGTLTVGASGTEVKEVRAYSASITPAALTANTVSAQDFTFTGVKAGDYVVGLIPPSAFQAVATVAAGFVKADDTVTLKFLSAATTAPTAGTWKVLVARPA